MINKLVFWMLLLVASSTVYGWSPPIQVDVIKYFDDGPVSEYYVHRCGISARGIALQWGLLTKEGFRSIAAHVKTSFCAIDPNDPTVPDSELNRMFMTIDTITELTGRTIMPLGTWESYEQNMPTVSANFTRSSETYTINGLQHVIVNLRGQSSSPNKPMLSVSASNPLASEAKGLPGQFSIHLSESLSKDLLIKYRLRGTAINGKDYRKLPTKVILPAGSMSTTIQIVPIDDLKKEKTESVKLKLRTSKFYTLGNSVSLINITDND